MKKVISMLLMVALSTFTFSCDNDDDKKVDVKPAGYVGTVTVERGDVQTHIDPEANFVVDVVGDNVINIEMKAITFAPAQGDRPGMPELDITIPNLKVVNGDFEAASVVPTVEGAPMASYTMTNIDGDIEGKTLEVSFDCMGFEVEFEGIMQ